MPQLDADRYVAEIEASTAGLAEILAEYDQSLPIPTCPEWTLRQLVTHVGRAHRWAAEITRTRSEAFIPLREVPDGKLPDDRAEQCAWLRAGAARIVDAVRAAGSDLVWSFTGLLTGGILGNADERAKVLPAGVDQLDWLTCLSRAALTEA